MPNRTSCIDRTDRADRAYSTDSNDSYDNRPKIRHFYYAAYNGNIDIFRNIIKERPEFLDDYDSVNMAFIYATWTNQTEIIDEMINNNMINICLKETSITKFCAKKYIISIVQEKIIKEISALPLPDDIIVNIVKNYL